MSPVFSQVPFLPESKEKITSDSVPNIVESLEENFLPRLRDVVHWPWIEVFVVVAISLVTAYLVGILLSKVIQLPRRLKNLHVTDKVIGQFFRSARFLVSVLVAWNGLLLVLSRKSEASVHLPLRLLAIYGVFWLLLSLWDVFMDVIINGANQVSRKAGTIILPFTRKVVRVILLVLGILIFASAVNLNLTSLWATIGVGGIALTFAAKDSIENFFGSLTIVLDMPFGLGDWVRIGNITGEVEEINVRSTKIRTWDDSLVTLPNSNLVRTPLENFGLRRVRNITINFPLCKTMTADKLEDFKNKAYQITQNHKEIDSSRSYVRIHDVEGSGFELKLILYAFAPTYADQMRVREEILLATLRLTESESVEVVSPYLLRGKEGSF